MKYRYCDMHCDTLTAEGNLQATFERHKAGGCYLQCFAAFLFQPDGSLYRRALAAFDKFDGWCKEYGLNRVGRFSDLKENAVNAVLTVEEGAAIEGDLKKLDEFYARGVRMMTLTWNFANRLGYPNLSGYTGADVLPNAREGARGLTEFGVSVVEHMKELHMIVDVSHGSDALVRDVKEVLHDTPFVASHSDAASVFDCPRNLRDEEIRAIAESGGVIGLNFCADFLSEDKSKEGQRAAALAHAKAILNAGGEDVLALGSDFDGIPENAFLRSPADVPQLLADFEKAFGARVTEKIAKDNFLRVFRTVCG